MLSTFTGNRPHYRVLSFHNARDTCQNARDTYMQPCCSGSAKEIGQINLFLVSVFSYGYRGRDCRNNLFVLSTGELIFFTAAVVVLYDVPNHKQRHYTEHTDDVKR